MIQDDRSLNRISIGLTMLQDNSHEELYPAMIIRFHAVNSREFTSDEAEQVVYLDLQIEPVDETNSVIRITMQDTNRQDIGCFEWMNEFENAKLEDFLRNAVMRTCYLLVVSTDSYEARMVISYEHNIVMHKNVLYRILH